MILNDSLGVHVIYRIFFP